MATVFRTELPDLARNQHILPSPLQSILEYNVGWTSFVAVLASEFPFRNVLLTDFIVVRSRIWRDNDSICESENDTVAETVRASSRNPRISNRPETVGKHFTRAERSRLTRTVLDNP